MELHDTKLFRKLYRLERNRILRISIFVLILLIIADFVLADYVRTPKYDCRNSFNQYIISSVTSTADNLKSHKNTNLKVVFIGDSVIYSLRNCNREFSIPKYYQ